MSNLAAIQSIYAAFGRGDVPAILAHMAPDVRWEDWASHSAQKAGVPWLQARQGPAGVAEFFAVIAQIRITDFRVLSLMEGGNQVAAEIELTAETPGGAMSDQEIHLWTFNEAGQVSRMRHYVDSAKHIAVAAAQPAQ